MACNYNLCPPQTSDKTPVIEVNVELGELNPAQVNVMISSQVYFMGREHLLVLRVNVTMFYSQESTAEVPLVSGPDQVR